MQTIDYSPQEGWDTGKSFVITAMPAFAADKWARRILQALVRAGVMPNTRAVEAMGLVNLANTNLSLLAYLDEKTCDEALGALQSCCKIRRDPFNPSVPPMPIWKWTSRPP